MHIKFVFQILCCVVLITLQEKIPQITNVVYDNKFMLIIVNTI